MKKRKILIAFVVAILLFIAYVFRWNIVPLQKKELEHINPISYTFSSDLNSTREKLLSGFSTENQIKNQNVFSFKSLSRPDCAKDLILAMETKKDALFGKTVFDKQEH